MLGLAPGGLCTRPIASDFGVVLAPQPTRAAPEPQGGGGAGFLGIADGDEQIRQDEEDLLILLPVMLRFLRCR